MKKNVYSHDEFFKRILSSKSEVTAFLKSILPDKIKEDLLTCPPKN